MIGSTEKSALPIFLCTGYKYTGSDVKPEMIPTIIILAFIYAIISYFKNMS